MCCNCHFSGHSWCTACFPHIAIVDNASCSCTQHTRRVTVSSTRCITVSIIAHVVTRNDHARVILECAHGVSIVTSHCQRVSRCCGLVRVHVALRWQTGRACHVQASIAAHHRQRNIMCTITCTSRHCGHRQGNVVDDVRTQYNAHHIALSILLSKRSSHYYLLTRNWHDCQIRH